MDYPKITHNSATADNATATVSVTTGNNEAAYLAHVSASFDGTVADISVQVRDGSTVVWEDTLPDQNAESWSFLIPLKATVGNTLHVDLAASGTGGTSGTLHVWTFKGE